MSKRPFVSIVIPCRNEEKYIAACLDSVLAQDYPSDSLEILLADGASEDRTRSIIDTYARRYQNLRWFENPKKILPAGLNMLIREARGEVVIRLDAHSLFSNNYISKCVKYLNEYGVDCVGGLWETRAGANTLIAQAIALALTSLFGVGSSTFRLGANKPIFVETVPFACYRRDVFNRIGFFNEDMVRNEDVEFNTRLRKVGGKILLHPDIASVYFARPDLISATRQKFQDGFWCVYGISFALGGGAFFPRHLVPMIFVLFLVFGLILGIWLKFFELISLGVLALYVFGGTMASVFISVKHGFQYFPFLMMIFPAFHFSYGIGSICGMWRLEFEQLTRR